MQRISGKAKAVIRSDTHQVIKIACTMAVNIKLRRMEPNKVDIRENLEVKGKKYLNYFLLH